MRTRTALAASALVAVLALSGCSVGDVVKTATDGQVELGKDGQVSVNGTTVDTDGGSLPNGWPSELPVPSGKILSSANTDGTFIVSYELTDDAVVTDLIARLESAGYTESNDFSSDDSGMHTLSNGTRQISLLWGTTGGVRTLSYLVSAAN